MEYTLKRSRRKSIAVVIAGGVVEVRAPLCASACDINSFVLAKRGWINKKLIEFEQKTSKIKPVLAYEVFLLHGRVEPLVFKDNTLASIKKFYLKYAKVYLLNRLSEIANALGFNYNCAFISSAKSRWGSCDVKGNIRLNWRLLLLPHHIQDYVIIHELCHLKQLNHSKQFWASVQAILPNYKKTKKELKELSPLIKYL